MFGLSLPWMCPVNFVFATQLFLVSRLFLTKNNCPHPSLDFAPDQTNSKSINQDSKSIFKLNLFLNLEKFL